MQLGVIRKPIRAAAAADVMVVANRRTWLPHSRVARP
jgi:hypothetical protein